MNRQIDEREIAETSQKIAKRFNPERIILFGSWAWGKPGPDSDVDFFIVKETENTRDLAREIDGFLFPRPFPLDVIVYRPEQLKRRKAAGDPFITEILTHGKVLYAR